MQAQNRLLTGGGDSIVFDVVWGTKTSTGVMGTPHRIPGIEWRHFEMEKPCHYMVFQLLIDIQAQLDSVRLSFCADKLQLFEPRQGITLAWHDRLYSAGVRDGGTLYVQVCCVTVAGCHSWTVSPSNALSQSIRSLPSLDSVRDVVVCSMSCEPLDSSMQEQLAESASTLQCAISCE